VFTLQQYLCLIVALITRGLLSVLCTSKYYKKFFTKLIMKKLGCGKEAPHFLLFTGRDSSVGEIIWYGLDVPGIEPWFGRDLQHQSRQALRLIQPLKKMGAFPVGKEVGAWRRPPPPLQSAEVREE
jgi:hypothetical protein